MKNHRIIGGVPVEKGAEMKQIYYNEEKVYKIDFKKVHTIDDIKNILESLGLTFTVYDNYSMEETFPKIKEFLVEQTK
jgi:hypothetical protein